MASIWGELRRRNVFKVAVAYAIVAWLIIEMTSTVFPALKLPEWTITFVTALILISFPVILIGAWAIEITPDGMKRTREIPLEHSITHITGRKFDFTIIGLLAIAVVFLIVDNYVLVGEPASVVSEQTVSAVQPVEKSIAVLPFVNMSSDPEQEYFSDGLSEEILNLLAKVHDLKVIARTSSFAFKGKNEDIRIVGKTLGVNTVLEGSVRKSGERVRITAQLINVADGAHLWSETYDRTLTDIFAVQDDVAAEILDALQIHVSAAPKRGRPTQSTEAYTFFLKARAAINSFSYPEAVAFLTQSVALDPKFAEAHELLAYTHWWNGSAGPEQQRHVLKAAADALAIDPSLLFAQALLVEAEGASYLKGIEAYERVLRQKPSHVGAMDNLAWNLLFAGYFRESEALAQRLAEIDPLSTSAQRALAEALGPIGRVDECLAAFDAFRHLNRENAVISGAWCLPHDKRAENSLAATESYLQREGLPTDLIQELAAGASDPTTGQALLDRLIPLIVAEVSDETAWLVSAELHSLYLSYGFLDRYYEIIDPASIGGTVWSGDSEVLTFIGQLFRQSGFTTHPRYLELAEANGLIELWDQRGAPDHCEKVEGLWVCG